MLQLLVLADDFTGAIDTGVQFVQEGIRTQVVESRHINLETIDEQIQVLVIDMETRHIPPEQACEVTRMLCSNALKSGIKNIYKKTDSGLRGNVGSELQGIMDASGGKPVFFAPAYPKTQRVVRDGILYIQGKPVTQTVFGNDPFEPVCRDYIPDIIAMQSSVSVRVVRTECLTLELCPTENEVLLFDAEDEETLRCIARRVVQQSDILLFAGCAGFARCLPDVLGFVRHLPQMYRPSGGLVAVSGSLTSVNLTQLRFASLKGIPVLEIPRELQGLSNLAQMPSNARWFDEVLGCYHHNQCVVIASTKAQCISGEKWTKTRAFVAENIARIARHILELTENASLAVFGGDTLQAVLRELDVRSLEPVCEIEAGVVYSRANCAQEILNVISKSGNLGGEDAISRMVAFVQSDCKKKIGTTYKVEVNQE